MEEVNKPVTKRRKRRRTRRSNLPAQQGEAPLLLCFDSETTHHGEILELSVFDIDGNEVYHAENLYAKFFPTVRL